MTYTMDLFLPRLKLVMFMAITVISDYKDSQELQNISIITKQFLRFLMIEKSDKD